MLFVDGYRDLLVASSLTPNTIRSYELRVRQALEWCRANGVELLTATPSELSALAHSFPKTATIRGQLRSALKHYYRLHDCWDPPLGAIAVPKQPNYQNRALSPAHAQLLHKTARFWVPEGTAVMFGLYLGMRVSEIAAAEWSRFDQNMGWYRVMGKGNRTREIPVHPTLAEDLRYVRRTSDFIFPGSAGRDHVRDNTVWKWIIAVGVEAGIGRITSHQLRHTAITEIYDRTGDLLVAQEFAGHTRPDVTRRYTRLNVTRLTNAVLAINYEEDQ